MASDPLVVCILLTRDRPAMAKRAVECFRAQSYAAKKLVVLDTSATPIDIEGPHVTVLHWHESNGPCRKTIGALRNTACTYASKGLAQQPDIIAHWDDDDVSHPQRLAEQVSLLQSSGADCVGYREALFWNTRWWNRPEPFCEDCKHHTESADWEPCPRHSGEAWLYSQGKPNYCLGTSLMYWRSAWQRNPFPDTMTGEDARFCAELRCVSESSIYGFEEPRMIASIHGSNTSGYDLRESAEWKRVPHWDTYCAERMKL